MAPDVVWTLTTGLWAILPAYVPNSVAVVGGGPPIDGGRTWRGRRVLGDGKTRRGFVGGTLGGGALALSGLAAPAWTAATFTPPVVAAVVVLTPLLHVGTNAAAYLLGLKDEPWWRTVVPAGEPVGAPGRTGGQGRSQRRAATPPTLAQPVVAPVSPQ